jgi:hypothetical protein
MFSAATQQNIGHRTTKTNIVGIIYFIVFTLLVVLTTSGRLLTVKN